MIGTTASAPAWDTHLAGPIADDTWLEGDLSARQIADDIARPLENRPTAGWWMCLAASSAALMLGVGMVTYQIAVGIGTWGLNNAVGWAFDITNFVFWIGIGHAGTLISAILLLFRQSWRTSVNRSAEAMTIFAVLCAALFPLIHMGRPWLAFWVMPYPNGARSAVGQLPIAAPVGRLRDQHLPDRLRGVLVPRHDPGLRAAPRSLVRHQAIDLRRPQLRLGRQRGRGRGTRR